MRKYINTLLKELPGKPEHVDFITDFYTIALVNALIQWIQDPNPCSPEDMFELLYITVQTGIKASLRRDCDFV